MYSFDFDQIIVPSGHFIDGALVAATANGGLEICRPSDARRFDALRQERADRLRAAAMKGANAPVQRRPHAMPRRAIETAASSARLHPFPHELVLFACFNEAVMTRL